MELRSLTPVFDGLLAEQRNPRLRRAGLTDTAGFTDTAWPASTERDRHATPGPLGLQRISMSSRRCPNAVTGREPTMSMVAPSPAMQLRAHCSASDEDGWQRKAGHRNTPSNKEMKLTSVERIGRSQLISSVRWTPRGAAQPAATKGRPHGHGRVHGHGLAGFNGARPSCHSWAPGPAADLHE